MKSALQQTVRKGGAVPRGRLKIGATIAIAVAGAAVAATLAATWGNASNNGGQLRPGPAVGKIPTIAGNPNQVIATLQARFPVISNAHVGSQTVPDENGGASTTQQTLYYDLSVASTSGADSAEPLWEGQVFAGAVANEFAARGFTAIKSAAATLVTPDGKRDYAGGGIGGAVSNQVFHAPPSNIADIAKAAGGRYGLHNFGLSIRRGLQEILVMRATTSSPASTAAEIAHGRVLDDLLGGPAANYEAAVLTVKDEAGNPVLVTGVAPRSAGGTFWVRPGLGIAARGASHEDSP